MTVFDNLRYILGNVQEQRRVPSRCVTTAVKDIHIHIQHQQNRTLTAEKKRLRNDRCTPASHFRPDNTESPARKWHQSTTTLCGSSADIQTQASETAMVQRPSELHTTSVDGSYEPVIILYNHRTYTRWKLHFFRSGIPSPCYPFPI